MRLWIYLCALKYTNNLPYIFRLVVAHEGDSYSLVESSVVHLLPVGQVGPGYKRKHPLLVSFLSNVPS